jgi:hydrogenase maturation protein HypF
MALILAFGAFLKNMACLLDTGAVAASSRGTKAPLWSALHGDLSDPVACTALAASVRRLLVQAGRPINAVAHDLHPDFFSTRLALQTAAELQVPAIAVQHHHAHIAAIMAEHAVAAPVLGLALDGIGLGSDGGAWGGELLLVHGATFERLAHLLPLALPGGDVAAREPWRMAAAVLHASGKRDWIVPRFGPVVGESAAKTIAAMLQRGLNCPPTTAAGRWFDAAAGLLGLSVRQTEEAQAAIALEQAAAHWLQSHALPAVVYPPTAHPIDLRSLLMHWLDTLDLHDPIAVGEAAARFHLTLATALAQQTVQAAAQHGVRHVALGGGCFFNRILTSHLRAQLERAGLRVCCAQSLSCGDAGLALGQAWVAAHSLQAPGAAIPQQESTSCV